MSVTCFFTPLEQFDIIALFPLGSFQNTYFSITNSTLFLMLAGMLILVMFHQVGPTAKVMPGKWQTFLEELYMFAQTLVEKNIGRQGSQFFPLMSFLFVFLTMMNLVGLIPYSFTVTSHIFATFSLALTLFTGMNMIAMRQHKLHFLGFFLPAGVHLTLAPLLVPIELVSYTTRVFSLAMRLFANMMSGHTLLKMIAGFAWTMISAGGIWYVIQIFPLVIIMAVTVLELGMAVLQAYVFTMLMCLYLSDAMHLAH